MKNNRFSNLEIISLIQSIETQYPVDNWYIGGVHVWPLIRNNFPYLLIMNSRGSPSNHQADNLGKILDVVVKVQSILKATVLSAWVLAKILMQKKYDVILVGDGISYTKVEDCWVDRFCDPLKEEMERENKTCLTLEQLKNSKKNTLNQYFSIHNIESLAYYAARIINIFRRKKESLEGYDAFLQMMQNYGIEKNLSIQWLQIVVDQSKIISYFFGFLFDRFKIKQAFIVCYYGMIGYGLSLAGYKRRINIVDIEHGSIINCPAYCGWTKVPNEGYELLPTSFELWDQRLKDIFDASNSFNFRKVHQVYVAPLKIINYSQEKLKNKRDKDLVQLKEKFCFLILVTLQPQFYGYDDWNKLASVIPSLPKNWGWIIRPHPAYHDLSGMNSILAINQENVFYDNVPMNLYEVLREVKCHITTASASCLDAMIMKVPTIFISQVAVEDFKQFIDEKQNFYAEDILQIKEKIRLVVNKA